MRVADFDFDLDPERIAQRPVARRDRSRLMVLDRSTGGIEHRRFFHLPRLLRTGDLLVFNDTRVLPARLVGTKESGGRVEVLLLERGEAPASEWQALVRAARPPQPGSELRLAGGLRARVIAREGETWRLRFSAPNGELEGLVQRAGRMPLPPYIAGGSDATRRGLDRRRYQTVFARRSGAVAAPTAGLHFTRDLLQRLERAGIAHAFLTLHVGLGTFQPVRAERVEDHRIHDESFEIGEELADAVRQARERGGRVVAVGTTVVRTLEHRARRDGRVRPGGGRCDLFIYPGYQFKVVDAMITNFHLPRSTLLMLVAAFAGRERILEAYARAISEGYRFYSYGDAMLIEGRP